MCQHEQRGGRRGTEWYERKSIRVGQGTGKTSVGMSQLEEKEVQEKKIVKFSILAKLFAHFV